MIHVSYLVLLNADVGSIEDTIGDGLDFRVLNETDAVDIFIVVIFAVVLLIVILRCLAAFSKSFDLARFGCKK